MFFIGFFILVFGAAPFVSQVAKSCDRSGGLWALLSIFVSGFLYWGSMSLLADHLEGDGVDVNLSYALLVVLAPLCGHAAVAALLMKLPGQHR